MKYINKFGKFFLPVIRCLGLIFLTIGLIYLYIICTGPDEYTFRFIAIVAGLIIAGFATVGLHRKPLFLLIPVGVIGAVFLGLHIGKNGIFVLYPSILIPIFIAIIVWFYYVKKDKKMNDTEN